MRLSAHRGVGALGRVVAAVAVVVIGLGGVPGVADAQGGDRRATATAVCAPAVGGEGATVTVAVTNESAAPLWVYAVEGFSTPQAFSPFYVEGPGVELVDVLIEDGHSVGVTGRWTGRSGGEGEGLVGGAIVVTNVGVLTPICSPRAADAGELTLDGPLPGDMTELRMEQARYMAETLGRLEGWRAYPLLYALLHPDAQAALGGYDRLACWYADQYGMPGDPQRRFVFSTDVSVAKPAPWEWEVTGTTYGIAVAYDYEQEVGTMAEAETVSGTAHLAEDDDGIWRWFFGSSRAAIDALPERCGA